MDEGRKQLLAILSIVAVMLGVIIFTSKPVEKKGIVSSSEVKQLVVTKDGRIQQGYWFFTLSVDRFDTLSFTLKPDNVDVSSQTGVPGSQVVAKRTIELTLEPLDRPWAYGDIQQYNYVFYGGDENPQTRGEYYEMPVWRTVGGGWIKHVVPYRLTIKSSDGAISTTRDVLCGEENVITDLPYGIEVRELGQLLKGVVLPSFDFAYVYGANGKGKYVRDSEIASITTSKTSLGDFRNLDIPLKIVSADPASETTEDPEHHYKKTKGWPGYRTELWCRGSTIEYYHTQDAAFSTQTFTWTFQPERIPVGYEPEVVTYEILAGGKLGPNDKEGVLNEYGTRVAFTKLTPEKKFRYQYYGADGTQGHVYRKFIFYGPADTWREAAYQSGIEALPEYDIKDRLEITTNPPLASKYSFVYWNPADPSCSFYKEKLTSSTATSSYYTQNKRTVVTLLSPGTFTALVQVIVPVQAFDSWVYIPPYGVPEVLEATCDTLEGGKHARMKIKVKNVGLTKDTFYLKDISLPTGVWIGSYPVSEITLDVNETGYLEFVLTSGTVEKEHTVSVTGSVIAKGSLKTDDFKFDLHLKPGVTSGPQQPGSIVVHVKDKKTGDYISGARVVLDSQFETVTDASGTATFSSVRAGGHTILVEKEGYISKSVSVEVSEGMTAHKEVLLSTSVERDWTKLVLMVSVPLVVVAGISTWYLKKKGKIKL